MKEKPTQSYPVKLGEKTFNLDARRHHLRFCQGRIPHPNTMTCKLMAGDKAPLEQEYYSPGGGFYEWKGYIAAQERRAEVSLRDHEGTAPARGEEQPLASRRSSRPTNVAVSGKTEEADQRISRQDHRGDARDREGGPLGEGRRAARPHQVALEGGHLSWERAQDDKYESDRAIAQVSAFALAASEENARGHLVIYARPRADRQV